MRAKKLGKVIWEWINKKVTQRRDETIARHFRLIDRENDYYEEVVTDLNTDKIIHGCKEPLSKHTGHGSAKNQKNMP